MVKEPGHHTRFLSRLWGTHPPSLPTRLAPSLPRWGLALTLSAAATLGAILALRSGPQRPAAAYQPPPLARSAAREVAPVQPGYLVRHSSPPVASTLPPQVSSRGGERPTPAPPTPTPTPEPKRIRTYRVAAGDTVAGLAERFGISVETILWANGLRSGTALQPGQELTIPPVSGVLHRVRLGDTLYDIAVAYGVPMERIAEASALEDANRLAVDQLLVIPGGRPLPPPTPRPMVAPPTLAPAPTLSAEASGKGGEIVAIAARYLGYAYVYGGSSPRTGFDCSGFAQYVYGQAGLPIPRDLWGQLSAGPAVKESNLLPGDLVFFHDTYQAGLSHVGIYVGGGNFIHASSPTRGVCYDSLGAAYWVAHYYAASRPWQ